METSGWVEEILKEKNLSYIVTDLVATKINFCLKVVAFLDKTMSSYLSLKYLLS